MRLDSTSTLTVFHGRESQRSSGKLFRETVPSELVLSLLISDWNIFIKEPFMTYRLLQQLFFKSLYQLLLLMFIAHK